MTWLMTVLFIFVYLGTGRIVASLLDYDNRIEDLVVCTIAWPIVIVMLGVVWLDEMIYKAVFRRKGD